MKKKYIIPISNFVSLHTESLIAQSIMVDSSDGNAISGEGDDQAWTQRHNSIWDYWTD